MIPTDAIKIMSKTKKSGMVEGEKGHADDPSHDHISQINKQAGYRSLHEDGFKKSTDVFGAKMFFFEPVVIYARGPRVIRTKIRRSNRSVA